MGGKKRRANLTNGAGGGRMTNKANGRGKRGEPIFARERVSETKMT